MSKPFLAYNQMWGGKKEKGFISSKLQIKKDLLSCWSLLKMEKSIKGSLSHDDFYACIHHKSKYDVKP